MSTAKAEEYELSTLWSDDPSWLKPSDSQSESLPSRRDKNDMAKLGKRQQLTRNFGFMSMVGFTTTCMSTWEALAVVFLGALENGGPVALVYGFILCWLGSLATAASIGELSSIWPTSGSQYHWTAELAPARWKRLASWIVGWITVFGWQMNCLSAAYFQGTLVQGLIILNVDTYVPQLWHGTFFGYAGLLLVAILNIFCVQYLPHLEGFILIIHVVGFFAVVIPLVYLGPQSTPEFVFATFWNEGGWSSNTVAWCVGSFLTSTFPLIGYDGSCHMSEEIKDAAKVVPRSMLVSIALNGALGLGIIIAMLFSLGDINAVLSGRTGYPFIEIFHNAVDSKAGATAMAIPILVAASAANLSILAGSSRQTWALARDNGIPFSNYFRHISTRLMVPVRSITLVIVINVFLLVISTVSPTAFNAFTSVTVICLYVSYGTPIAFMIMKRLRNEPLRQSSFSMGRWGLPVNVIALVYTAIATIFLFFPPVAATTPQTMNFAVLIFSVMSIISVAYWFFRGRKIYQGPLKEE